jgi:hypothetical protein
MKTTTAVLTVFCVFAMSMLTVLMLGAGVYRNIVESAREGYEERVCLSYIWSKAKNNSHFYIGEFHGQPAMRFDDVYGGTLYRTVIYSHDGWLRELFFEDGLEFNLGDGEPVARVDSLRFTDGPGRSVRVVAGKENLILSYG